ncbi:MAG: DUF4870 domain-containing protein [Candidatus Omnitrophota bacterium]|nr:DUF4870 domain-containing protein [Candidatus Omnitrophota bacterium]
MDVKEEKNWALFCHLGGLLSFIVPLVIWLTQKDKSSFVDEHGKEALNFQISLLIYYAGLFLVGMTFIGLVVAIPGMFALGIADIIFIIMGAVKASNGESYKYPLNLRLIK